MVLTGLSSNSEKLVYTVKESAAGVSSVAGVKQALLEELFKAAEDEVKSQLTIKHNDVNDEKEEEEKDGRPEEINQQVMPLVMGGLRDSELTIDWDELDFQLSKVVGETESRLTSAIRDRPRKQSLGGASQNSGGSNGRNRRETPWTFAPR